MLAVVAAILGITPTRLVILAAVAGMCLATAAATYSVIYQRGKSAASVQVERQNETAVQAGGKARRPVDDCYDSGGVRYDARTGECIRDVPDVHR